MSKENLNQPAETESRLVDRSIPLAERIELARTLVKDKGQMVVLLARTGAADGLGFSDNDISDDELKRITDELGFEDGTYDTISAYEWRTTSKVHRDLVLQVIEGPLDVGGATELFPNGKAWSEYDYINTFNILVRSTD